MPPVFSQRLFRFPDGEVPNHVNRDPQGQSRDVGKFALVCELPDSGRFYPVATDIDDLADAQTLKGAHETHNAANSGFSDSRKIVHILPPLI
jgi:hypothetical protein